MSKLDYELRDAGAHYHSSAMDRTLMRGSHMHLLSDLKTVLREGEHTHDITELQPSGAGVNVMTKVDGAHVHEIVLGDGTKIQSKTPDGAHPHEVTPDRSVGESGQHVHVVKIGDMEYRTLSPEEIHREISKGDVKGLWAGLILGGKG